MNEVFAKQAAGQRAPDRLMTAGVPTGYREDITLRENIDEKIENHKKAIAELETMKEALGPLLDMRIDFLSKAMSIGVW